MNKNTHRSKTLFFMRFLSVLIPTVFFSYVTDTLHLTALCLIAGAMNIAGREPVKITLRSIIYSITLSLTVIVLTNTIFKIEGRFYLTPSEMGVPAALVFAMALLYFDDRPTFTASILILSIFSMMMCGDITNSHSFRTLPLPDILGTMDWIHLIYVIFLFLCAVPFFYLMNRSQNKIRVVGSSPIQLKVIKFVLVFSSLLAVLFLYSPTQRVLVPFTKNLESRMVRALSQWRFNKKKTAFQQHVNLRDSYFSESQADLDTVLIRVDAPRTPGYIRSRIYEAYKDGVWGSNEKSAIMNLLQEDHEYSFNTFSFNGLEQTDRTKLDKIQIYYSSDFRTSNILHQGKSRYVEMTCETLNQTESGSILGKQVDFSGGITLFNDKDWSSEDSFWGPELKEDNIEIYRNIYDKDLHARLNRIVKQYEIFDQVKDDPLLFAAAIKYFFNTKYKYKLGVKLEHNKDPVIAFLEHPDREGHCEYFATTSVMLLRSQGIPARYVTGFYCQEEHPSGKYYMGRSKDLHAWVEFYDEKVKAWRLLEPTPASGMPSGASNFNFLSSAWDSFKKYWQDLMSNIVRGYFAESVIMFLKGVLDLIIWCFSSIPNAIVSCTLIYLYLRRRRKKRSKATLDISEELVLVKKDVDKLMKKLKKIKGFNITPSMTLRDIAAKMEELNNPALQPYMACFKEYETLRYSSNARSTEKIAEIRQKIGAALKARIR